MDVAQVISLQVSIGPGELCESYGPPRLIGLKVVAMILLTKSLPVDGSFIPLNVILYRMSQDCCKRPYTTSAM